MKNKKIVRLFLCFVVASLLLVLSSCSSCGASQASTKFQSSGLDNSQLIGWINDNQELKVENPSFEIDENLSDTEKVDKINALIEEIAMPITIEQEEKIVTAKKYYDLLAEESKENVVNVEKLNNSLNELSPLQNSRNFQKQKELSKEFIANFVYETALNNLPNKRKYQKEIIEECLIPQYQSYIDNTTTMNKVDDSSESSWSAATNFKANCTNTFNREKINILNAVETANGNEYSTYEIVCAYVFKMDEILTTQDNAPIKFHAESVGDFFGHLFNNLLIFPIAWLIVNISNLFGGIYFIGLLIVTILVRTIAWPIYAKTNDMSLKMQLMQPELNEIQKKYANRQDERSKQMMQMETAQLYKKYKVGIGGCLMPLLQFPIFMAIYRAVNRIPYTVQYANTSYTNNWANELNPKIFGINLLEDRTAGTGQLIGIIILMIIVVGTQFLSQWLSQRRQKINQDKAQEDIPEYRRKAYNQEKNSTASSMKFMMYGMMLMMGLFVFTSKAGLGVYWCIGNLYSMLQMEINSLTSKKRMEQIKKNL